MKVKIDLVFITYFILDIQIVANSSIGPTMLHTTTPNKKFHESVLKDYFDGYWFLNITSVIQFLNGELQFKPHSKILNISIT
jgi:hypothetical protein